jgi:hypothetical protein
MVAYSKLDGDGEEVDASLLRNLLAAGDTGQVDVARLDQTLLALEGLEDLLSKARDILVSEMQRSIGFTPQLVTYRKPA